MVKKMPIHSESMDLIRLLEKAPVGFLSFDASWKVTFVNSNFFEFGVTAPSAADTLADSPLPESELVKQLGIEDEVKGLAEGLFFEKEISSVRAADGSTISIVIKGTSLSEGETFTGGLLLLEDIRTAPAGKAQSFLSKKLISRLVRETSDIFFITDPGLKILFCHAGEFYSNFIRQDAEGVDIRSVLKEDLGIDISGTLQALTPASKPAICEFSLSLDEKETTLQFTLSPFSDPSAGTQFMLVFANDVSAGRNAEQLNRNEIAELKQYQFITSAVTDAVIATDTEGSIYFWNKSAEKLFNYSRSEVYGKFIGKVLKNFSLEYFEGIKDEIKNSTIWESELKVISGSGKEEFISLTVSLTGDEDSQSIVFLCSSITERTRFERDLRISEERFRNIVINANEFICNLDPEGNITYVNPSFIKAFEYTEGELLQRKITDLFDQEYKPNRHFRLREYSGIQSKSIELACRTKSGAIIYLLANFSPIADFNNVVKYFNGIFTNITEKKMAEKELMTVRSVYEASRDGISVDTDGKFILVNDSFAQMFGYQGPSELLGRDSFIIVADEDIRKLVNYSIRRNRKEQAPNRYDFVGRRKDGSSFFVEASVTSYEADGRIYTVRICRDITERKRAQEALKDSEEKYRSITENIDDFLWTAEIVNSRLRPVFYTTSIEKVTGYPQEQFLVQKNFWFKIIYPDDIDTFKRKIRNVVNDAVRFSDEFEFRIVNQFGNLVWVRNKLKVIRNSEGRAVKLYGLVSDISLSKKADEELKKSAAELRELNSTKDKFISIISHDLRTPFSSIMGFTDILLSNPDLGESQRTQYITFIQESSQNMLSLVNSLLDWTRLQTGRIKFEPERIKASDVITKSLSLISGAALKKNITLKTEIPPDLFIHADLNLMLQVINNLFGNSIKFTKEGGSITVSAKATAAFDKIQFTIADTGVGIKKEDLGKLFKVDSKFTLEGTSGEKGSGLGLSIVHDIIERHGGEIWVESEYGKGSEFHFTIPVASAHILLVDDSRTDRLLYSKILKNLIPQYKIYEANNGREAFDFIVTNSPALVITDHSMPEMSGYDLVKKLKLSELKAKPPVIILSADVNSSIVEEYRELGVEYIFQKPVNLTLFKEGLEKSLKKAIFN